MKPFVPIAIVGAACRLPGGDFVDAFWASVLKGETHLGPVPESRFNRELFYDPTPGVLNKTYADQAGLIEYRSVDRSRYPLPPNAENDFDVSHLEFAQTVVDACRDAGYEPTRYPHKNSGVYSGHTRPGTISQLWSYRLCLPEVVDYLSESPAFVEKYPDADDREAFFDGLEKQIAAWIPPIPLGPRPVYLSSDVSRLVVETLKINGPNVIFNSACASSLHAIGQAIFALAQGRIDSAIAGGATFFHSDTLLLFANSRSMTTKRSCPFDRDADGMIIGEGNVAFILKRLDDAIRDGDRIRGVFTGVGVASDGKGKSLWAPRKEGQILAVQKAYPNAEALRRVDYVEAHATSTALGDATELEALSAVFAEPLAGRKIPLGSAKGNVGHTLEVAGATGVLKAMLALENGVAPPVGGLRNLNPKIAWDDVPFFAPTKATELEKFADRPRRAAINSFGIGGLNVHLVLDEYVPDYWAEEVRRSRSSASVVVPSSVASQTKSADSDENAVAIVGIGCILPDAYSTAAFAELLESGANAFRSVPKKIWNHEIFTRKYLKRLHPETAFPFQAGVIDRYAYDWKKNKIPPKQIENASPIQFMMLDAVNEAFETYGKDASNIRERTGVVVGTSFGGDFASKMNVALALPTFLETLKARLRAENVPAAAIEKIASEYSRILHKKMPALLDETGSFTPSALASRVTKTLDLMGGAVAVESEKGSLGAALACAIDQLLCGANDAMVCVGGEQDLGPTVRDVLFNYQTLARDPSISPFDAKADGCVPGEGCGVLILKRLADARRDGDRVFATIRGIGAASGPDLYENVRLAVERSGVRDASELPRLVEASFSGVATNDAALVDAIADVADALETPRNEEKIALGTVVNQIGSFGSGSATAACLKLVYEMEKGKILPCAGLRTPAAAFAKRRDRVETPQTERKLPVKETIRSGLITGERSTWYIRLEGETE